MRSINLLIDIEPMTTIGGCGIECRRKYLIEEYM